MFIQMVQGNCERQDEMRGIVDDWCTHMSGQPGWLGGTYGFTDGGDFVGVVRYESQMAAQEACASDEAAMWWAAAEQCFSRQPELHQATDVSMMLDGGSDDAGFVQIMRGRVGNADKLRRMTTDTEMTTMLHQARPDIIGGTLAIEDDGHFIETIAFTSEDEARQGEQKEMPPEVGADMAEAMADVEYVDLHQPWFRSRS